MHSNEQHTLMKSVATVPIRIGAIPVLENNLNQFTNLLTNSKSL